MSTEIRRSIIIGLGEQGARVGEELQQRLLWRYNGVPVVQSIEIVPPATGEDWQEHREPVPDSAYRRRFSMNLSQDEIKRLQEESSVSRWLPDIPDLNLSYRAGARLALVARYDELKRLLSDCIQTRLLTPVARREMESRGLRIAESDDKTVDLYLVCNLAEPFASGMFLDLAYLIKKVEKEHEADHFNLQVRAVMLLPDLLPEWQDASTPARKWMQANTYAVLKELDYYMHARPYSLQYPGAPRPVSNTEMTSKLPFEIGNCFLVTRKNAHNEHISADDAVNMVAEWLCAMTLAPIFSNIASGARGRSYYDGRALGAYGSFGLASLVLPMMYIRDYCARQLTAEMIATLSARPQDEEGTTKADVMNNPLLFDPDQHAQTLQSDPDGIAREFPIQIQNYGSMSRFSYLDLEANLAQHYNDRLGNKLPHMRKRMEQNRVALNNKIYDALEAYTRKTFASDPAHAIYRMINFFSHLLDHLQKEEKRLTARIRLLERKDHHSLIREARGDYFNAAQALGDRPEVNTVLTVVAFVAFFGWTYYIGSQLLGQTTVASVLVGLGGLLFVLFGWTNLNWIGNMRTQFIKAYQTRLEDRRKLEEARLALSVVERVTGWAQTLLDDVVKFRDEMITLSALAQRRWQVEHGYDRSWDEMLYAHPYFSLEESVINAEDVEAYYKEVRGSELADLERHVLNLFLDPQFGGNFYTWLSDSVEPEALWSRVYHYSAMQAETLDAHSIVEKIDEHHPQDRVRDRLSRIRQFSHPFLTTLMHNLGGQADDNIQPNQVVAVQFQDKQAEQSKVAGALKDIGLRENIADPGERHRLTFISVRYELPLMALPDVRNCRDPYLSIEEPDLLHTTRGNVALPDVAEGYMVELTDPSFFLPLDPRQLFALSVALNHYKPAPFDALQYRAGGVDEDQAGYYQTYVTDEEKQEAERLETEPRERVECLGSTKSIACAQLYTRPTLTGYLRQAVQAHLLDHREQWRDLALFLRNYVEPPRPARGAAVSPKETLEDWEVLALGEVVQGLSFQRNKVEPVAP